MKQGLRKVADGIMVECLSKCKDGCTFGMFRYYALPAGSPNLDRETMWNQLETHKFMVQHDIKGKAKVAFMPYIATAQSFGSLCDQKGDGTVASFPETYATQSLRHYLHCNPSREHNVQMLLQFFKTACVIKRGAKGRKKSLTQSRLDAAKGASDRLEASEDLAKRLLAVCEQSTASDRDMTKSPGRRRRSKSAPAADDETDITCTSASSQTMPLLTREVTYRYTLDGTIRTRRQVNEVGAQSCSRRVQQQLFPHTHDLDIENCSFVLLVQIIDKLQPTPPMPSDLKKALVRCP